MGHLNIATWFMINIYRLISAIFYLPNNIKSYKEIITFDVNITTQVLTKVRKHKRFEEIHNLINKLHQKGMGNKEIMALGLR